ncbi:MAG: hypothetical protein AB8E82_12240 [Aureispira sp.]
MRCLIIVLSLALCCCNNNNCHKEYSFLFPLTVSPQDTFSIGDTIWIEMQSSPEVLDHYSGVYYNLDHLDLFFEFIIQRLDTGYVNIATPSFNYIPVKGNLTYVYGDFEVRFESATERRFKFGIIPTQRGLFDIGMGLNVELYYLEEGEYKGENLYISDAYCSEYMYSYSGVVVNNSNNNQHLVQNTACYQISSVDTSTICRTPYSDRPIPAQGVFTFVVR